MEKEKLIKVLSATLFANSVLEIEECRMLAGCCAEELRRAGFTHELDLEQLKRWVETTLQQS